MSTALPPPAPSQAAIVHRLRTAGCVFAEDEARLLAECAATPAALLAMVDRRVAGEPLEHVVGWVNFCGLRIAVDPGVFVPRRRTELLVRRVAALAAGVALHAVDIEPAAVRCARRNLATVGGQVYAGDLYDPLPAGLRGHVDVLVANVPSVPTEAVELMPREARIHEPRVALDGGADGLDMVRRIAGPACDWLAAGGHLLVETGAGQAGTAVGVLARAGLTPTVVHDDDLPATVVTGRR